jgi:hypothetical protein
MEVKLKFKVLSVHQRNAIVRWFTVNTHRVWIILDNGEITHVHTPRPNMYEPAEFLTLVTNRLRDKLLKVLGAMERERYLTETKDGFANRIITQAYSFQYCGLEGELTEAI